MRLDYLLLFLFFMCFGAIQTQAYVLQGVIHLDDGWERKIYLSDIPAFDEMNTASEELILNIAEINADGSFIFRGNNLPVDDRLYRLHVCKKGDPAATLFIGGKEENHLHFVMDNSSELFFSSDALFRNAEIKGQPANHLLFQLQHTVGQLSKPPKVNSQVNRDRRRQRIDDFLLAFADTCSHAIPAMLAFDCFGVGRLIAERPDFLDDKLEAWASANQGQPYLQSLQQQVDVHRPRSKEKWLLEGGLILALLLVFFFLRQKFAGTDEPANPEDDLSLQERRVLKMLSGGKSNKEISEELHIEVSTVKSHVSSIYSKLGVRSRKEVVGRF